jgi:hypothetical protein
MVLTYPDAVASRAKTTPSTDIVEARFVDVVPGVRVVHAIDFVSDDPANAGTTTVTFADFVERLRAAGLADEARNGTVRLLGLDEHGPMFGP